MAIVLDNFMGATAKGGPANAKNQAQRQAND